MTIVDAVREAMGGHAAPMTQKQVYDLIVEAGLYHFKTDTPLSAVRTVLERHSEGSTRRDASSQKFFRKIGPGVYALKA